MKFDKILFIVVIILIIIAIHQISYRNGYRDGYNDNIDDVFAWMENSYDCMQTLAEEVKDKKCGDILSPYLVPKSIIKEELEE